MQEEERLVHITAHDAAAEADCPVAHRVLAIEPRRFGARDDGLGFIRRHGMRRFGWWRFGLSAWAFGAPRRPDGGGWPVDGEEIAHRASACQ